MKVRKYTGKNKKIPEAWRYIVGIWCLAAVCFLAGCARTVEDGKKEKTEYEVCEEKNLPHELKALIKEKEKKAGTFTYKNSSYLYVIICYGTKPYSGYSIRVEECCHTEKALYIRTRLIGPKAGEPVVRIKTFPWIVLRCPRMEVLCIIDS